MPQARRSLSSPNQVMALAVAAAILLLAACAGLVFYASQTVDRIVVARETRLMTRAIDRRLTRLQEEVSSVTVWDEAYDKTARIFDAEWARLNYGVYYHQYLKHSASIVFDARDRLIYASEAGEGKPVEELKAFADATRPIVAEARARAARKIAAKPDALGFDRVGAAEAVVRVGSRVYLAAASTVVPEVKYGRGLLNRPEPVAVSAVELDAAYLKMMSADYGLRDAVLAPGGASPSVTLVGAEGAPVALLGWTPERLGSGVLLRARWPILAVALTVLAVLALVILRLRHLTGQLSRARDRAQAGDEAKSQFIANMSHEIRTPLNGVLGMAQAMAAAELSVEQRARLDVIQDSGATLLGVLNDVLDLAKIEAGKLELEERAFRIDELGQRVVDTFAELAAAKDLALTLRVEPSMPRHWLGDALRLRQVLSNLVSNAIKFTQDGSVVMTIEPTAEGVRLVVRDTGIGLSEAQIPSLFDKFSQADASTTRRYGGTGLGLSICADLVRLMGGSLRVESRLGEGSAFTVEIPLRVAADPAPAEVEPAAATVSERSLRILVAEDNPTNQLVLRALMRPLEADLVVVSDGRAALEAFDTRRFDLVLMDIQMPELNGVDATRMIRAHEIEKGLARTPILALTANVMSNQLTSYAAAGMDGFVPKPIDAAVLYAEIETALGNRSILADVA